METDPTPKEEHYIHGGEGGGIILRPCKQIRVNMPRSCEGVRE